jgi:hypothetical protein
MTNPVSKINTSAHMLEAHVEERWQGRPLKEEKGRERKKNPLFGITGIVDFVHRPEF